jgi:hypothetical protein
MAKSSRRAASPRAQKQGPAEPAEVEIVEEKQGTNWEGGVAIVTTMLLVAAILFTDYHLGVHYGAGMFFK